MNNNQKSFSAVESLELSIVMPCLNEAETLASCIDKAFAFLKTNNISGEVIVADNGSTDGSQEIAGSHNARIVNVSLRGYGAALMGGIKAAKGKYIIMADADGSYDLASLTPFIEKLREGYDLVMGNRFRGGIRRGAMRPLHRYLGNPVLTGIGRLFYGSEAGDFHCGLRGFSKDAVENLDLRTTGMEFASEMVVKATLQKLRITEVPTTLDPVGRGRPSHLKTWRDGWRHLRFMLIYSPNWLFLYPGMMLMAFGITVNLALISGPLRIRSVNFDIHTMLYASIMIILGLQIVSFALFSKVYAMHAGLLPEAGRLKALLKHITLERGLFLGGLLTLAGMAGSVYAFILWERESFGTLVPGTMMRLTIPSLTLLAAGIQIMFSSFFLSILALRHR